MMTAYVQIALGEDAFVVLPVDIATAEEACQKLVEDKAGLVKSAFMAGRLEDFSDLHQVKVTSIYGD